MQTIGGAAGALGVDCFFVLSGFLLFRPFRDALAGRRAFPSIAAYAGRRCYRILPLYLVAVAASALLATATGDAHPTLPDLIAHLTLTHNFVPEFFRSAFDAPLWTMPLDADFYVVMPLFATLVFVATRPLGTSARLAIVTCGTVGLFAASLVLRLHVARNVIAHPRAYHDLFFLLRNGPGMSCTFCIGVLLALALGGRRRAPAVARYAALAAGLALIACSFAPQLIFDRAGPWATFVAVAVFGDAVGALACALVLFACLEGATPWATALLETRLFRAGSRLSYAAYLVHAPCVRQTFDALHGSTAIGHPTVRYGLTLALVSLGFTAGIAYALHELVEKPFLLRRDRLREIAY